jgi:hypothetical protein
MLETSTSIWPYNRPYNRPYSVVDDPSIAGNIDDAGFVDRRRVDSPALLEDSTGLFFSVLQEKFVCMNMIFMFFADGRIKR